MFYSFLLNGLINGSILALVALGFALVYNTTRIFHIAYAGIYTWAGYLFYLFVTTIGVAIIPSLLLTILATVAVSVLCEYLVYRPVSKKYDSSDTLMISSIGIFVILVNLVVMLFGNSPRLFPHNTVNPGFFNFFGIPAISWVSFVICSFFIMFFFLILKFTAFGIKIRAVRDDPTLSRVFGIRTGLLRLLIFALSGMIVAIAASFESLDLGVHPYVGLPVFINAFIAMVIGGTGRFEGAVIGGILLGLLQSIAEYFIDSQWVVVFTFGILIVFLAFKPQGIIPERQRAF